MGVPVQYESTSVGHNCGDNEPRSAVRTPAVRNKAIIDPLVLLSRIDVFLKSNKMQEKKLDAPAQQ